MANLVTGDVLAEAITSGGFIKGGDAEKCADGVKYDFRLGQRILKAKFKRPVDTSELTPAEKRDLEIEPGEVVFVLTEERLELPENMMAQLSPKRKLSHAGILTLGGFCIDPGYRGRLLIGLFNLSSTAYPLRPGRKVIAATFHQLEGSELGNFPIPEPLEDFPDELVEVMQKYDPVGTKSLADHLQKLQSEVEALRLEINSHNQWYERLEDSLERHDKQIGKLIDGLSTEHDARKRGEDKFSNAIDKLDKTFAFLKGAAWVIGTLITLIGLPILWLWMSSRIGGS